MTAALDRGLDFAGVKEMEVGAIVDFCIEYNNMHDHSSDSEKTSNNKPRKRKATQADWDALAG